MGDISRRRVLGGAVTATALMTGCGTRVGASGSRQPEEVERHGVAPMGLMQIGANARVRGVSIGPGVDDFRGDSAWTGLWQRWDWGGRIKNEIDDAVAIGANCVRLIGNTHVVTNDIITRVEYLQRWSQFLDYTMSVGLWVYPCGGDLSHWGGYTTLAAAKDLYQVWAELLANYDHVIGVDVTNEAPAQSRVIGGVAFRGPESWLYTINCLGELVRAASGKPITHSRGLTTYDGASWEFGSPETDAISDFLDVHAYRAISANDADVLYSSEWGMGKQLLIGEFGANLTIDSVARTAIYDELKALIGQSTNCVGGLAWAIYDTGSDPASLYGLYDQNRVPRADIASVFGTFPATR